MASTPYKPVSWSDNEPLKTSKLNQMTSNEQFLFENSGRMYYSAHGIKRTEGCKIACGVVSCAPVAGRAQNKDVYFGTFFSPGCRPVVTFSLIHNGEGEMHIAHRGLGTAFPDHRGFQMWLAADRLTKVNRFTKPFWISWIAMGF